MRIHLITWVLMMLVASVLVGFVGCSKPETGTITINSVGEPVAVPSHFTQFDTCYYDIPLQFSYKEEGDYYFKFIVTDPGGINEFRSVAVLQHSNGSDPISYVLRVPYYGNLTGACYLDIVGFETVDDTQDDNKRAAQTQASETVTLDGFSDGCGQTCCTNDLSRHYAGAMKNSTPPALGAEANIAVRWPKLCADDLGIPTIPAQSNAFVCLRETMNSNSAFAQIGYGMFRREDIGAPTGYYVYAEYRGYGQGSTIFRPLLFLHPVDVGSNPLFRVEFLPSEQKLEFGYNAQWWSYPISSGQWFASIAEWVVWSAEILGRETDLVGTGSEPCTFSNCKIKRNNGQDYVTVEFATPPDKVVTTDPAEWTIRYTSGADNFEVYDNNPLD
jgi:hypothetical protein